MKIPQNLQQTSMDKTREVSDKTRDLAQKTSAQAQKGGQQMYQRAQTALQRATVAATVGGVVLRYFIRDNERKMRKNRRAVAHKAHHLQDTLQNAIQPTLSRTQNSLQGGVEATQDTLRAGLGVAQNTLQKSAKGAQKVQQVAQERLASGWSTAQDSLEAGWSATQDVVEDGSKRIRKNLEQVATTTKDAQKALQTRHKHHQRQRAWARRLFRWGLVSGFVVALLFAPTSGAETRKRIGLLWDQYKQYLTLDRRNDQAV